MDKLLQWLLMLNHGKHGLNHLILDSYYIEMKKEKELVGKH